MSAFETDLLKKPLWQAGDLGRPMPPGAHAVSVALPRWQDVVGYEEKDPRVISQLAGGYPRFVVHPLVREAAKAVAGTSSALAFPSEAAAGACADYLARQGVPSRTGASRGLWAVATSPAGEPHLKDFWQHTGLIVTSRQAEDWLANRAEPDASGAIAAIRRELAAWYGCADADIFLFPTGMAAIHGALLAVNQRKPASPTLQVGFPYVDTLKLQEKFGNGVRFVANPADAEKALNEEGAGLGRFSACICEIPGNPLLGCPDVSRLSPRLRAQGVPLVVDDVVATPRNVDLTPYADVIVTSLTKYWVGSADVMGGAMILNPKSPFYATLRAAALSRLAANLLWGRDALVIEDRMKGFGARMDRHNAGGLALAEHLKAHPLIDRVWYPKWECTAAYEAVRRPDGGWGGLLAILVKDPERNSARVYDTLPLCKGPSLGTIFTLACPFTLLAHYRELEWAESCGVSRHLIRISVGIEDPEELWRRIRPALDAAAGVAPAMAATIT